MCTNSRKPRGLSLQDGRAHTKDHATWSRRDFLTGLGLTLSAGALTLSGLPVRTFARTPALRRLAELESDRILVVLQLSGGNDGLNTVVPVQNDEYYRLRPGISIAGADAIPIDAGLALHPSLASLAPLYATGNMGIVQSVGYADASLSHFESTDYWMSGGFSVQEEDSGWSGRYLESLYPDLEEARPEHPAAVQFGGSAPMMFQGPTAQMGMTIRNIQLFDQVASTGEVFATEGLPETLAGEQLRFMRGVANDAFVYASVIQEAATGAANQAEYPTNGSLGDQLAAIARLIRGGLSTRIYHVTLGSFDTHSAQTGRHSALLAELAGALSSFMSDLAADGLDERVLVMTFSEFGRRAEQNGSGGTDHGSAAPLFLFGPAVSGGLTGSAPDLTTLDDNGNLHYSVDFREVYASVLQAWFGLDAASSEALLGGGYEPLSILESGLSTDVDVSDVPDTVRLHAPFPNPARDRAAVPFRLRGPSRVRVDVFDMTGRHVVRLCDRNFSAGSHQIALDARALASGVYAITMEAGGHRHTKTLSVQR